RGAEVLGQRRVGPRAGVAGVLVEHGPAQRAGHAVEAGGELVVPHDGRVVRGGPDHDDVELAVAVDVGDQRRVLEGGHALLDPVEQLRPGAAVEEEHAAAGGN